MQSGTVRLAIGEVVLGVGSATGLPAVMVSEGMCPFLFYTERPAWAPLDPIGGSQALIIHDVIIKKKP